MSHSGAPRYCHNAAIYCVEFILPEFIANTVIPRIVTIYAIHFVYCGYCDLLGCTGNPIFHAIYCAHFGGMSLYADNAAIYCAIFILPVFIANPAIPQITTIHTIHFIYFGDCDLLVCTGNPLFHAIYCAHFGRMSVYSENPTIYCASFIMQ